MGVVANPVILTVWEAEADHLRSGVGDQPGQHGETPPLLKIQRLARHGRWASVVPATLEGEAGELLKPRGQKVQ